MAKPMADQDEKQDIRNIDDWEEVYAAEMGERLPVRKKERPKYSVIHHDERIVVFDKAAGIATIPERFRQNVSLKEIGEEEFGPLWTVHRIDKDTSGVVLFARDAEAHKMLNEQFQERQATKIYAAILEGELPQNEMVIDIPIATDPRNSTLMKPSASGKESVTVVRVRELYRGFTYAEAQPFTGRQHQIRVHCAAVGMPLLIDAHYGNRAEFMLSAIKRKYKDYGRDEKPLMSRLTLHAEALTVTHPATGELVTYRAELPKDMVALLTQLRKVRGKKKEGE